MEELNHQMMLEISHLPRIPFDLSDLHSVFERVPMVQEKYGFITRDIHLFISHYPEFARLRKTLVGSRIEDMINQLSVWAQQGICHEDSSDHNHKRIAVKMWLFLASWSVQDTLLRETDYALSKEEYLADIYASLHPLRNGKIQRNKGKSSVLNKKAHLNLIKWAFLRLKNLFL
jgi:hypothetical protein